MTVSIKCLWEVRVDDITLDLFIQCLVCTGQHCSEISFRRPSWDKAVLVFTHHRRYMYVFHYVFGNNFFQNVWQCWQELMFENPPSPLWIGQMLADFQMIGNTPAFRDFWKILLVSGILIGDAQYLRTFIAIKHCHSENFCEVRFSLEAVPHGLDALLIRLQLGMQEELETCQCGHFWKQSKNNH